MSASNKITFFFITNYYSGIAPIILLILRNFLANFRPFANNHFDLDHDVVLFSAFAIYTFSNLSKKIHRII